MTDGKICTNYGDGKDYRSARPGESDGIALAPTAEGGYLLRLCNGQRWEFNANGYLVTKRDLAGNLLTVRRDRNGISPLSVEGSFGKKLTVECKNGRIAAVEGPAGMRVEYRYDARGRPAALLGRAAQNQTYAYDTAGMLSRARIPGGRDVSFSYQNGLLSGMRRGDGTALSFRYLAIAGGTAGDYRQEVYNESGQFLGAMEIRAGRLSSDLHIQADRAGLRIAEALKRAAGRGVEVCLLIDGFGSSELPEEFADGLRKAGVGLLYFRPDPSRWQLKRNRLRRMHRKVAVADGRLAFVGGINIEDDIQPGGPPAPRFDFAVAVEGPLVSAIHHMARRLWGLVAWSQLRRRQALPALPLSTARAGEHRAALARRDNLRHRHDIERAYLDAIARSGGCRASSPASGQRRTRRRA